MAKNSMKLYQSAVAEKRFNEMIASQEKMFETGNGPFYVGNTAIQEFFVEGVSFLVTDAKPGATPFGGAPIKNVFVRLQYPEKVAPKSGVKRLKTTYLVVPASNGWVLAPPRSGTPNDVFDDVFAAQIQRMTDVDEYLEPDPATVAKKEALKKESMLVSQAIESFPWTRDSNSTDARETITITNVSLKFRPPDMARLCFLPRGRLYWAQMQYP